MGLFGPFTYENSEGETFWLHKDEKGNRVIYYFSKNPEDPVESKPDGYIVAENPGSNMPYLKKGQKSIVDTLLDLLGLSE